MVGNGTSAPDGNMADSANLANGNDAELSEEQVAKNQEAHESFKVGQKHLMCLVEPVEPAYFISSGLFLSHMVASPLQACVILMFPLHLLPTFASCHEQTWGQNAH